ncbi:MAG: hypothetical protein CEO22_492 [Candidatus Berkelbacteria bacterium Gr01-1014_85]|uniref:Disulfide bond formation protein DsbB n=1 Tax=Candidatus Berkelbacteria bacterium Gr01-1014_85 TaxID=2017150 RepID=A0A554JAP4_9BACT|nr:MAG: hypothetical protein CEO22_492 [Candidatus Berkelbacteria bacterium Gr01-1014_85]
MSAKIRQSWTELKPLITRWLPYKLWLISLVAMLGSLYFSEIRHINPCPLCWYQRIFAYPNAILIGLTIWQRDRRAWLYVAVLALGQAAVALYHVMLQAGVPGIAASCSTNIATTCAKAYPVLGPLTLPQLSLIASLVVLTGSIWLYHQKKAAS